jgi:hypothetical protein
MPAGRGPVAQWSELAAHNRLVGGSSPPGPTTHSRANGDFPALNALPRIGGIVWVRFVSAEDHFFLGAVSALLSLLGKYRFPETETRVRRDAVRTWN